MLTVILNRRKLAGVLIAGSACALVGCADHAPTAGEPPSSAHTTASSTAANEASESNETTSSTTAPKDDGVATTRAIFGSLAPDSLWEQVDLCDSTRLEDTYECSGEDVGQFQLYRSKAKAASTTQVLTELRSSTVVEDTGRFVVGWSTLGTTAVITVVDNDEGLVLQQLTSSEIADPEEEIRRLGLDQVARPTR